MPDPHLKVGRTSAGGACLVTVQGDVDLASVGELSAALAAAAAESEGAVLVDLAGVSFMGSEGLSSLLNALRRLTRAQRSLVLVVPDDSQVRRLLETTRLVGTFKVQPDVASALAGLDS